MQLSKKLMIVITAFWILSIVSSKLVFLLKGVDLSRFDTFVNDAFMISWSGYIVKSGTENGIRMYKNSQNNNINI